MRRALPAMAAVVAALPLLGACGATASEALEDRPLVIATTPILADIASQIAGPDARVTPIVPAGADPHTYEPRLSTLREITRASIAIENGLLLEDQSVRSMVEANLPDTATRIVIGEDALVYGAYQIPLVEDRALDTVWLGLRVAGQAKDSGPVEFRVTGVEGPGDIAAFTTGTFGQPAIWLDSSDGIGGPVGATNAGGASTSDAIALPTGAHTHMSWGFTRPGNYTVNVEALSTNDEGESAHLGATSLRFAVGVEPGQGALTTGHVDLTADPRGSAPFLKGEEAGRSYEKDPAETTIAVPHSARTAVPADPQWRFLGRAGEPTWILAQAVIGKHVHGEMDPHMWLDVHNVRAYVEVIADALATRDPNSSDAYRERANAYIARLDALDTWAASVLATIPAKSRRLVTAHDAYGYLARGYGLAVTGFASANPTLEPSAGQLATLSATMRDLDVPAVFIESSTRSGAGELRSIAASLGIRVCSLTSDTLTPDTPTYVDAMVRNVMTLKACLDPHSLPAWKFDPEGGPVLHGSVL